MVCFGSPFTFTGELLDANDLLYLRARYYSPALGVFTALDPVENLNRYQYVNSNPTNKIDPTGMFGWGSLTTEPGDYCYCIGREGGIPDGLLENFAIWLKNNNPGDAFMSDTPGQKYWLYPGKTLTIPDSFMGVTNIHDIGVWKRNGCFCPSSINSGRCNITNNPVQLPIIDTCKCPEGMVWDSVRQWCGYPCPSGGVRPPGGFCPGISMPGMDVPPLPPNLRPDPKSPSVPGGQITPPSNPTCIGKLLDGSINQQTWGWIVDISIYAGKGAGGAAVVLTDGNEVAIYSSLEAGVGLGIDLPAVEVLATMFTSLLGLTGPYNIFSESDLDGFATRWDKGISLQIRTTAMLDRATIVDQSCQVTQIRGVDAALGATLSAGLTFAELYRTKGDLLGRP